MSPNGIYMSQRDYMSLIKHILANKLLLVTFFHGSPIMVQLKPQGDTLTVYRPTPETFKFTEEGCSSRYKTHTWTTSRQSLIRHLEKEHDIRATTNINIVVFFRSRRTPKEIDPTFYQMGDPSTLVKVDMFTTSEVSKRLKTFENTAPGED
ncbi:unnamed protein product [Orchesella dallaii]|uniref:Uncharacterized protein n=1 Tax=Orchesella dallaii TaxID=48710 RepID=A0ABP1S079_9HEXA